MLYYLSSGTDVIAVPNPNLQTHLLILIGREEGVVASPVCSSVFFKLDVIKVSCITSMALN